MIAPKNILVTTTSSIGDLAVKQYIKPISAHIVAGTNFFSDFFASFSDVFGGRSETYQKQLSSLYNDAIERLKIAAYEIGANCIIGLQVDLDEISGKGKSMFMVTAIGTAVIVDDVKQKSQLIIQNEKFENVSIDRIKILKKKRQIITMADEGNLILDEETWEFIISNQLSEVFDLILLQLRNNTSFAEVRDSYYKKTVSFFDSLPEEKKIALLYESIMVEENESLALKLCAIIEDLQLLDLNRVTQILETGDFQKQKRGLRIITYDKLFYNKQDVDTLHSLIEIITIRFPERGVRLMKKQLLSSKEKEVWICECKNTIEIGKLCGNCKKDIYGFISTDVSPQLAILSIEEKISLVSVYL